MSERIDAYAHIGLPRFATAEQLLSVLDRHGVARAVVAAADTCPDLAEVSRAAAAYPERLRAVGVPLGETEAEIRASLEYQARAGFLGIRIFDRMLAAYPALLEGLGDLGLVPYVVGGPALAPAAKLLADFLAADDGRLVVAPHFGGVAAPELLDAPGPVNELFSHPRLLVIFSRHGAHEPLAVRAWARALAAKIGWGRILFGSEFPVCLWRGESYQSTLEWVNGLEPPETAGEAFAGGNARRLWERRLPPARELQAPRPPAGGKVTLFPQLGLDIPEELHQRWLARYLESGGGEDYRVFVTRLLLAGGGA